MTKMTGAGGKPSTWFPPERLVELRHDKKIFFYKKMKIFKKMHFFNFYENSHVVRF